MIDIEYAKKVFKEYINNYDINNGKIALKVGHILRVCDKSNKISKTLNLSEENINLATIIGLLHDIGRFEQVKQYGTFNDTKSVNHGELGVKILFEDGLINKFKIDEKYFKTIRIAILNHNKSRIQDKLTENELLHCKIIRDSDKLDIFNVLLIDKFIDVYGCESMENETFSNEIIREFKEEHLINYKNRKTYGDLWICHMAYVYDLNFEQSYQILKKEGYINKLFKRVNFKKEDTLKQAKEIVCDVNNYINKF